MGRGGRGGGRSPTQNDDRSRSMNDQDVCGQAAMANTARQLRDNEDDYDDGYDDYDERVPSVEIEREEVPDYSHWGVYRDEPRKEAKEVATIKRSGVGDKYIVTYSNDIDILKILGITSEDGISVDEIPIIENLLIDLGYEVVNKWEIEKLFFY